MTMTAVAVAVVLALGTVAALAGFSFGSYRDQQLAGLSGQLFGVGKPLAASSTKQISTADALADPTKLATLANGLHARVVTTQGPAVDDQISLWPNSVHPTYIIVCNEEGTSAPGLVRIQIATGKTRTCCRTVASAFQR
jgi:hypothetical protein